MKKRNRTKLLDRQYNKRDARLFVIATEGRETEKQYLARFHDSRIKIEILATGDDNKSAPQYVLERLDGFVQKYDLVQDDTLWLMFDVDRWGTKNISAICRQAKQKKYRLAISNPCFEVWLYLHFDALHPDDKNCQDFEARLRKKLGSYNKSNLDTDSFKDFIEEAVQRAKNLHPRHQQNWPPTPGSHVYRVVETLLKAIKQS
jgi:predicted PolB exonuclease-like 3'-5' exonuclease